MRLSFPRFMRCCICSLLPLWPTVLQTLTVARAGRVAGYIQWLQHEHGAVHKSQTQQIQALQTQLKAAQAKATQASARWKSAAEASTRADRMLQQYKDECDMLQEAMYVASEEVLSLRAMLDLPAIDEGQEADDEHADAEVAELAAALAADMSPADVGYAESAMSGSGSAASHRLVVDTAGAARWIPASEP